MYVFAWLNRILKILGIKVFLQPSVKAGTAATKFVRVFFTPCHKEKLHDFSQRPAPLLRSILHKSALAATLSQPLRAIRATTASTAAIFLQINDAMHLVVHSIGAVAGIFEGIFLSVRVCTSNVTVMLSLISLIVKVLAMVQNFFSVLIFALSYISTGLAKLKQPQA
ncbi:unnamed protein product [Mesocestoides corti]|uniref:Ammonium_transp domain-containing protein n=1 Tax=Mesocestoides corti TaxID=53468 RepID=A0A0R3UNF0_MESCO|nr:unnamed protein product [Mesocestoides corti]